MNNIENICVWADGSWYREEDIDDMDIFLMESRKSDDFEVWVTIPGLSDEYIDNWVETKQRCENG